MYGQKMNTKKVNPIFSTISFIYLWCTQLEQLIILPNIRHDNKAAIVIDIQYWYFAMCMT